MQMGSLQPREPGAWTKRARAHSDTADRLCNEPGINEVARACVISRIFIGGKVEGAQTGVGCNDTVGKRNESCGFSGVSRGLGRLTRDADGRFVAFYKGFY